MEKTVTHNPFGRLEAFCDGVFAIALTLLIIEIKIPHEVHIESTQDLWLAIEHLLPSLGAFLLSFIIILISWFNHHSMLKLVSKLSPPFIFANGFLLLSVVVVPFPTNLMAEYGFTKLAAPAVVLYSAAILLQNIAWMLCAFAALKPRDLTKNDTSKKKIKEIIRNGMFAFPVYIALTVLAFWFPLTVAAINGAMWLLWLVFGITIKQAGDE